MKKSKCLLSVAMIVKDEEHNIRRALESVKDVADEIIVVDTGSKDRTPEIAREYTDKVFFHPWKNDFSEARNYSLKFPTCEWVLILDADEEVSQQFQEAIRNFLENLPRDVNTVYLPTVNYLDWNFKQVETASTARIFRNGTVYYKNIVHNQPVYKPKVVQAPYIIYHYGYIWTRRLRKAKYNRTRNLIIKHLKDVRNPIEKIYYLVQLYKTESIGKHVHRKYDSAWRAFQEIKNVKKIPAIGLEFLFLFGLDCVNADLLKLAKVLFETAIKSSPKYPDPYFGMLAFYEREEKWEEAIKWGEKFIEVFNKVMNNIEKFEWTVMSMKFLASAHGVLARAYLKIEKPIEASKHILESLEISKKTGEDIQRILNTFLLDIQSIEKKEVFVDLMETFEKIVEFSYDNDIQIRFREVLEKALEFGLSIPQSVLKKITPSDAFEKCMIMRLMDRKDHLLDMILDGKDAYEFVTENGVPALLFLYNVTRENIDNTKLITLLNEIRKNTEDKYLKGTALALIGDINLKAGRYREALAVYRKAMEETPELSRYIKPIIEDLKTALTTDIEGVYEELMKHFSEDKELIFDLTKYLGKEVAKRLYFISDHPIAIYVSAISQDKPEKTRELLKKITDPQMFPFYYYRLAKTYEGSDKNLAFEYHIKACEENGKVADLKLGKYIYTGLYPNTKLPFMKNDDEIIWVGNLSEKFSTLGIIHPVRSWRKCEKGFLYSYPYPDDEALRIYKDREEKIYKERPFSVKAEDVLKILSRLDWKVSKIFPEELEEKYRWVFEELEIEIKDHSKNIVVVEGIEEIPDLKDVLKGIKEAVIFFHVPNLDDREDPVWFYPRFRILRSTGYMKKELRNLGYEVLGLEVLSKNLRCIHIKKE